MKDEGFKRVRLEAGTAIMRLLYYSKWTSKRDREEMMGYNVRLSLEPDLGTSDRVNHNSGC